ncbi:MAG: right-handed parallel beta-helix repeat-containing protein [Candidatus Coatesbacteria bacterium]|nr:right-handed parallel beta-helix repeat-containing protein [Candidatus Coatesbacteria bacterium]
MRIAAVVAALALTQFVAFGQPSITVYTDASSYQLGETIEVSLSAENAGEAMSVDVYVGLILPNGEAWTARWDGWGYSIQPWLSNHHVPAGFEMEPSTFWTIDLPSYAPPIASDGDYAFAALLTYPGTFDWLANASLAPFAVEENIGSHYYVDAESGSDDNDGSSESPWRTITHALASVDGSKEKPVEVHVAAGTYATSTNGETLPLNMKSYLSLSGKDAATTILDAESEAPHVIYCESVDKATIERLTITGGNGAISGERFSHGAGIYCCENGSVSIRHNTISGNVTRGPQQDSEGGGIYSFDTRIEIDGNTITKNSADQGGAITCFSDQAVIHGNIISGNLAFNAAGICCSGTAATITANVITNNVASSSDWATAGIECYWGSYSIIGNTISNNSVQSHGCGAMHLAECHSWTIEGNEIAGNSGEYCVKLYGIYHDSVVRDNSITDNSAYLGGGGLFSSGSYAQLLVDDNKISGNTGSRGGGMYFYGIYAPAIITGNSISGNSAFTYGGGIYLAGCPEATIFDNIITGNTALKGGGIYCAGDTPEIRSNTMVLNTAPQGGAVYNDNMSSATAIDCILWDNGESLFDCIPTYCCIESSYGGITNVHDNPLFVLGPLGDYYLDPNSPCIDTGSRLATDAGLSDRTTQADGTPDAGYVDMGYHYPLQ